MIFTIYLWHIQIYNNKISQISILHMPKQPPSASNPQSQDLQAALAALYNSAQVIYYNFEFLFKFAGLLLIAFVMYKIGKLSVSEPIAQKVSKIEKKVNKYQQEKLGLAAKIQRLKSFYNKFIGLFLVIAIAVTALFWTQNLPIQIQVTYLAPFFVIPFILYTAKLIHISNLSKKSKKFVELEQQLLSETKQINKVLGSKVQSHLRSLLCRQKINAKQNAPTHICSKKDCQQMRDLLRARYQITKNLAECALQFQWCSTCKNRKPFDQLVRFQAKPMPAVRDGEVSEQQDADMKTTYLVQILQQMDKWVQEAGPCNCSKLYMQQIIKNKKNANRQLKQINSKLQSQQKKRQLTSSTVIRTDSRMSNTSSMSASSQGSSGATRVYYVKKDV